jgi:hypothetical protein
LYSCNWPSSQKRVIEIAYPPRHAKWEREVETKALRLGFWHHCVVQLCR